MPVVTASSFADPNDVVAYNDAKARGCSEEEALRFGDNGKGKWGDDTSLFNKLMCALPPEDLEEKWGNVDAARGKKVSVTYKGKTVICELRDTMPHKANITNGAGIDLNPAFGKEFKCDPPFMLHNVKWEWAD